MRDFITKSYLLSAPKTLLIVIHITVNNIVNDYLNYGELTM